MDCPFCHCDPCTCVDAFYGPVTLENWIESLNASVQDLAYGRELGDNKVIGGAGVRWATAWGALDEAGVTPQWNGENGKWEL